MTAATALAWQHYQAGNLGQADAICRQVLDAEPQCLDALYLLGVVCHVQGRIEESISLYRRLLAINPNVAEVHNSLGAAWASQGRLDEAAACYREAVRLKPEYAEPYNNLGFLLASRGEGETAVDCYRRALALKPRYPAALSNLGVACVQLRRLDEAVRCFQEALALEPQSVPFLKNLGNALLHQGKTAEAADSFRQALRLHPDDAEAQNGLGAVHRTLHQWEEAEACLRRSVAHSPDNARTHRNLGSVFHDQGKYAEALACYRDALRLNPDDAETRLLVDALSGSSQLARVPTEYLAALYDGFAPGFELNLVDRLGYRSPALMKEALGPAPAARSLAVLDLGCGTGLCGVQFRDWAHTLIGVDLSANMLDKARERGLYDRLIRADLLDALRDLEGPFDLILASDVILYLGDLEPLARGVHRLLRPGGRFVFTVDLCDGPGYRLLPFVHFAHSRAYLHETATRAQLHEARVDPVAFPRDSGRQAAGLVVVWSRP
jgi:predicted TPR repeat methyltransferase